jgi:uncharacterized protein (UPF0332 family)
MTLKDWQQNGWVIAQTPSREAIAKLLAVAERDLAAAQISDLVADWRLTIAYNSALQSANAALAAAGYRAAHDSHHYQGIQSLSETIKADPKVIAKLDKFRKKRHQTNYEISGAVSDQEVAELLELARQLLDMVRAWLRTEHTELLP